MDDLQGNSSTQPCPPPILGSETTKKSPPSLGEIQRGLNSPTPHKSRSISKWFLRGILLLAGLLVGFVCIEVFFRVRESKVQINPYALCFYTHNGQRISTAEGPLKLAISPFTLYKNLPNQKTETFTINSLGFRGPEVDPVRGPKPRAIMVGGSAVFGLGAHSDMETLVACLQRRDSGTEWINAGVCGFLAGQELAYTVTELIDLQPDLIVVYDGWNDFFGAWFHKYALGHQKTREELRSNLFVLTQIETELLANYKSQTQISSATARFWGALLHRSRAYSEIRTIFFKPNNAVPPIPDRTAETIPPSSDYLQDLMDVYTGIILKFRDLCRARNVDLLLVFQPDLGQKQFHTEEEKQILLHMETFLMENYSDYGNDFHILYGEFIKRSANILEQQGIPILNVGDISAFSESQNTVFEDIVHTNPTGNELISGIIFNRLKEIRARTGTYPDE